MKKRVAITPEIMTKVWKLNKQGCEEGTISEVLGISTASVHRVVTIMTTAQNGGDVGALFGGNNYAKQRDFAKQMFGITEKHEEPQEEKQEEKLEEKQSFDSGDFKEFTVRLLFEISYQNRLLEKLCKELGVNEE